MLRRAAAVLLFAAAASAAEPPFIFRPGDRVVFLGDSITQQYQYSTYIELYLTTRFPAANMSFYNAGIGGDTAAGGAGRFAAQVLAENPAVVTIDFGMNDGGYGAFDPKRAEQYVKSTEAMLTAAKKAGVRVALISPNAVEVRSRPQLQTYLETQKQFYAPLKELAAKHDVPFVDQYAVTRTVLEKIAADNATVKPFPDGVHTAPPGGLLMAHTILTGLHAPAEVSSVTIDATTKSVKASHCEVKNPEVAADRIVFERIDEALPMPVLKEWRDLLAYVDNLKYLDNYSLAVNGLTAGKYKVLIDGTEVGTYTADELAGGVNLALAAKGPLYDQGMKVFAAINGKNDIVHRRFWNVVRFDPKSVPDWLMPGQEVRTRRSSELKRLADQIAERQAEVYQLARPTPHRFEVSAAH